MEQKFIRFAKVHGYLNAALLMCSGIVLMIFMGTRSSSDQAASIPLYLLVWAVNPVLITIGTIQEDARWFKPAKRLYIVFSVAGSMLLIFGPTLDSSFPLSAAFVILAVSLYGIYLLRFLEELFTDLEEKKRHQATVTITTIVCENYPAAPARSQPEQNQSVLPPSPPPPYTTVASMQNSTGQSKEFPTWT